MRAWLAAHPQVHFHCTPTSASWLKQVEGFFGMAAALRGEQREGPWSATRLTLSAAPTMISEGVNAALRWVGDRVASSEGGDVHSVQAGSGAILRVEGHRRAVYRADDGRLHILSPVCPHLGCLVRWNGTARSWDCPCHGSRFAPTGEVLEGPALDGLARLPSNDANPYAGSPPSTPIEDAIRFDTDKG